MTPAELPPLRDVIEEHGLGARKALGQHFLLDLNITRKIARIAECSADDIAVEVGPGPGGLTRALLETGARVIAIEKDQRCITALADVASAFDNRLRVIEADALKVDEPALIGQEQIGHVRLVSNLPYNISTELLIKWLKVSPRWWQSMTLMFQKEVADRIMASPGTKTYGRLSVITQAVTTVSKGFDLPARAFTPPPSVDSTVLHFVPKPAARAQTGALETVTAAAFSQRRKMLRSSLKPVFKGETEATLTSVAIQPTQRAEEVSVEQYLNLAAALELRDGQ